MTMLAVVQRLGPNYTNSFMLKTDGMEQVRSIENLNVDSRQFPQYLNMVVDRALRVTAYRRARQVQGDVLNMQSQAVKATTDAEVEFSRISMMSGDDEDRMSPLWHGEKFSRIKAELNRTYPNQNLFNVACPEFPFWMRLMNGGFARRGLTFVCARPKVGKSTLLLDVAIKMAVRANVPVLYLDTEMSKEELYQRALSNLSGLLEHRLSNGDHLGDQTRVEEFRSVLRSVPFIYKNIAGKPIQYAIALIRQFRSHYVPMQSRVVPSTGKVYEFPGPCLVVYDWLKIPDAGDLKEAAEYQLLGFQASALKDAANRLNIPILAAAQNNRAAVGIKDSDDWEEMAESFVSGSDRLAQFCSMLCILRNLNNREMDIMLEKNLPMQKPYAGVALTGANALPFNQLLHVVLHRGGDEWRRGIPLYLRRGWAQYTEMGTDDAIGFLNNFKTKKNNPRMANSPQSPPQGQGNGQPLINAAGA